LPELEWGSMTPGDFQGGLRLSLSAGWNQTAEDWSLIHSLNPQGCFVARHRGDVIATVCALEYGPEMGWIGMMLVDSAYRGMGIATRLMEKARQALAGQQTVQLDATPAGQPVYRRLGFKESFGLVRMVGEAGDHSRETAVDGVLRPMGPSDLETIAASDQEIFKGSRGKLLEGLMRMAPEYASVLVRGETIGGYVFGRHGAKFETIGPLVAGDLPVAKALCGAALEKMGRRPVAMDVPEASGAWSAHLASLGMKVERPFRRMFLGEAPSPLPDERLFAIAGPELG